MLEELIEELKRDRLKIANCFGNWVNDRIPKEMHHHGRHSHGEHHHEKAIEYKISARAKQAFQFDII